MADNDDRSLTEFRAETTLGQTQASRQFAEVQAAMVIAKRFPRDEHLAMSRIKTACSRKMLAEMAVYAYPRGGTKVSGPSIRLAEVLAQAWGNIDMGVVELERRNGESVCMAYAWDLETNTRDVRTFTVAHARDTKAGRKALSDERDIYELVANYGSRRKRACILTVIPGDVCEQAIAWTRETLRDSSGGEPLVDRVRKMVTKFGELGVTPELLVRRLGHKLEATDESELVALREIFISLRDGMSGREQWFTVAPPPGEGPVTPEDLTGGKTTRPLPEPQTAPEQPAIEEATPEPSEPEIADETPPPASNGLIWQVGAGLQPPKLMQRKTKSITDPVRVHVAFNQSMEPQAIFADDAQGMAKEWLQKNIAQNGLLDFRWVERASLMNLRTESMAESAIEEPQEAPEEDFEQDDRMQRYIDLIEATKGWSDLDKIQNQFLGDEQLDMDQKEGLMAAMADQRKAVKQAWM